MYEINLVPDIKAQMIKAQKVRNLVLFACAIASVAAIVVVLIFVGITAGQGIASNNRSEQIKAMSSKLESYQGLNELLTIQQQLNQLGEISQDKKVMSRVFNVLQTILPVGPDIIALSELNVNVANNRISFDAQADAGEEPDIDYRVLEAFKKSVASSTYDYGRYVDENGNEIPTMCVVEADSLGNLFSIDGNVYGKWARNVKGCDPSKKEERESAEKENRENNKRKGKDGEDDDEDEVTVAADTVAVAISTNDFEKIWRTPQITNAEDGGGWYKNGHMDLSGAISGVAHFESKCLKYTGTVIGNKVQWTKSNECYLAPDGVKVVESSNGRNADDKLVLKFSASIELSPEVFKFSNKHLIAIAPTGRQNVTDSYSQIDGMFKKPASDCLESDTACMNSKNEKGEE